jgi:molybdopterin converting factor small subunit
MPGFYSVEQVINLIEKIEEEEQQATAKLTFDQVRELTRSIVNAIEEEAQRDNIVNFEDVEFELGWDRKIEVTDVPINFDAIRDCVEEQLIEFFEIESLFISLGINN